MEVKEKYHINVSHELEQIWNEFENNRQNCDLDALIKRNDKMNLKNMQKIRLIKVYLLSSIFDIYNKLKVNEGILPINNTWNDAEKTADFINMLIPGKPATPEDFIYKKDQLMDQIIDLDMEFKRLIEACSCSSLPKKAVIAFCKKIHKSPRYNGLNSYYGLFFSRIADLSLSYFDADISNIQFKNSLLQLSLFNDTKFVTNRRLFRSVCNEIESTFNDILSKQTEREKHRKYGKQLAIKW